MPADACLRGRGKREVLGPGTGSRSPLARLLGGRALSSSSAQTVDGEGHWHPSLRLFLAPLPGLGAPSPGRRPAAALSGRPASGPHQPASGPADASPRLWPEPHPEPSPRHRCSHSLAGDELLGKITEPAFLNPPLSREKRAPSLLRPRAPGCPPRGPAAGC